MARDIFATYHPAINFIYFAAMTVFSVIFLHPLMLFMSFAGSVGYALFLLGRKAASLLFKWLLPLIAVVTAVNALVKHYGVTFLGYIGDNPVTKEAIVYGAASGIMFSSVILWCRCFSEVMTSDKVMYIFGRITPKISLIFSMTLRFIPVFRRQLSKVRQARKGMMPKARGLKAKVKSGADLFSIMLSWALENAVDTSDSMRSRGYGLKGRTAYSDYRFDARDAAAAALLAAGIITAAVAGAYGLNTLNYYPEIRFAAVTIKTVPVYIIYGALCSAPVILNGREAALWKRLRSKI